MAWRFLLASRIRADSSFRKRISSLPHSHRGFATVVEGHKYSQYPEFVKVDRADERHVETDRFGLPYTVVEGLKYSRTHEWVKVDGNEATIGVTAFGLRGYKYVNRRLAAISEIDGVQLPTEGEEVSQGKCFGKVETETKCTSVLYSPVSGKVVEVHEELVRSPDWARTFPYWWMMAVTMKDISELEKLMDADNYVRFCAEEREAKCLKEIQIRESVIKGLKYSDNHMWVKLHGNVATVGVTENGQSIMDFRQQIRELPKAGEELIQGNSFGKFFLARGGEVGFISPISGKVVAVNNKGGQLWTPDWFHLSPYEEGWLMKVEIKDISELEKLMDLDNYSKLCHEEVAKYLKETQSIRERVLKGLKYSYDHAWVKVDGNVATVGITRIFLALIGSVKHVSGPYSQEIDVSESDSDEEFEADGKNCGYCNVETVKCTDCSIWSPVSGKVVEVNKDLDSSPHLVNCSPYEEGWIMKVEMDNASQLEKLMDLDNYLKFIPVDRENSWARGTPPSSAVVPWDFSKLDGGA